MEKDFSDRQIIEVLSEIEDEANITALCQRRGISSQTFYEWRARFGDINLSEAKRIGELEKENHHLKQELAQAQLDVRVLKHARFDLGSEREGFEPSVP